MLEKLLPVKSMRTYLVKSERTGTYAVEVTKRNHKVPFKVGIMLRSICKGSGESQRLLAGIFSNSRLMHTYYDWCTPLEYCQFMNMQDK